jgi:hypothetical protein
VQLEQPVPQETMALQARKAYRDQSAQREQMELTEQTVQLELQELQETMALQARKVLPALPEQQAQTEQRVQPVLQAYYLMEQP